MLQDGQGNTPLHLAVAQVPVPWECVLELLERGAQVMSYMSCKTTPRKADTNSISTRCLNLNLQSPAACVYKQKSTNMESFISRCLFVTNMVWHLLI